MVLPKEAAIKTVYGNTLNLIPLAGRGQRFVQDGYVLPKPLIQVSGKPMIIQAAEQLPQANKQAFVCLKEHVQVHQVDQVLKAHYPHARIVILDEVTEGQACSCALGLTKDDAENPLLIGACDNGIVWDRVKYDILMYDPMVDAVIWTFRNHPASKLFPYMYGWVKVDKDNNATGVSVKIPISATPEHDHAIIGTFYFKKAQYFLEALKQLRAKNVRINGEFYVDSCMGELINMGLCVKVFEVDFYVGWGTPNDLKTYEYWQSFFHKCLWHPYRLEHDPCVEQSELASLDAACYRFKQPVCVGQLEVCQRVML
jgi:bifunctional N-acetylglucosamine-1-phosphate-uridyltransferase/glucosamine-1-phosphate-acetyltransferase GlmU-like protein